jgi:WD40 repeat protein
MIPINLIAALILPFVPDRSTWNNVCIANKELREAGKRMRPPWPNTTLIVGDGAVVAIAFSPCESFLVCGSSGGVVHVWDRHGKHTRLEGHTESVTCLQFSLDEIYLASGSRFDSIRLWRMSSVQQVTVQSDIILFGHGHTITAISFSPNSKFLAAGSDLGHIKLWDVTTKECIVHLRDHNHRFRFPCDAIQSISLGDNMICHAVRWNGDMFEIVENEDRTDFLTTKLVTSWRGQYAARVVFSLRATRFAALSFDFSRRNWVLAVFDLRSKAQFHGRVFLENPFDFLLNDEDEVVKIEGIAMSLDGKKLATIKRKGRTHIFECDNLTHQKYVNPLRWLDEGARVVGISPRFSLAFDPTSRVLATQRYDGRVELRSICDERPSFVLDVEAATR